MRGNCWRQTKYDKVEVIASTTFKFICDLSGNKFHLHINGTRIFQWLKGKWQKMKTNI